MAFQFRLATVLKLRESLEKQEERALQRIQLEIVQTSHQVQQTDEAIGTARRTWQTELQSATAAVHLQSLLKDEQSLAATKRALMEQLDKLRAEREQQLVRYRSAHRDHEALLTVRAEQRVEYEQQQTRAQQKTLDDIFASRMRRG